jgi:hypothetical protein
MHYAPYNMPEAKHILHDVNGHHLATQPMGGSPIVAHQCGEASFGGLMSKKLIIPIGICSFWAVPMILCKVLFNFSWLIVLGVTFLLFIFGWCIQSLLYAGATND